MPHLHCAIVLCLCLTLLPACPGADKPWPPAEGVPVTEWGKALDPASQPLPEYPRPQMVRERWLNLNGPWEYAVIARTAAAPTTFDGSILVPFAPQARLSRVEKAVDPHDRLWYRRSFSIPPGWSGQRILLHFGAVNWECQVMVNGTAVGTHSGGYDAFSFDISAAMRSTGPQELVVSAWNPVEGGQPRGKQSLHPGGIFYTPTTGIWQTVWLEPVPEEHLTLLTIVPDVDGGKVTLTVAAACQEGDRVEVAITSGGREIARGTGTPGKEIAIPIADAKLWWPDAPQLYDMTVTLSRLGARLDSVGSYFGMRKISLGPDRQGRTSLLLNNRAIFQLGLLDQGFWPDGIYTAPSDAALRSDLEAAKRLGCNMLRKHIKVEPERWYYWADRLGILVWQDMPSSSEMGFRSGRKDLLADCEGIYERELRNMVRGRFNHPSIVVWIPFNEGWGLTEAVKTHPGEKDSMDNVMPTREARMVTAIRAEDPTRLIDAESGAGGGANQGANFWDAGLGDIIDYHCYGGDAPLTEAHRASAIGETGWGVALTASLAARLRTSQEIGESAIVITQLTDVENETNGALRYDRSAKAPLEAQGKAIIEMMHKAGYADYPGGSAQDAR
jgi:Glycosyl hydrolases family 2, sugar binding domain/Glycosyl hydrolases family 2/Glycosyl hydrolases family 2, TIM barrel domain